MGGTFGTTGKRWLKRSGDGMLETGKEQMYTFDGLDIGDVKQVVIGHDGRSPDAKWFLDSVSVKSSVQQNKSLVFKCGKWLADLGGDNFIEQTLVNPKEVLEK